jgi:hypothetical protein
MYGGVSQQRDKWLRNTPSNLSLYLSSFPFKFGVLYLAFLQFPLHAYSVITLRISNKSLLTSGNVEQEWGFGQVSAMVLLAPNLIGLIVGITGEHLFTLASPFDDYVFTEIKDSNEYGIQEYISYERRQKKPKATEETSMSQEVVGKGVLSRKGSFSAV